MLHQQVRPRHTIWWRKLEVMVKEYEEHVPPVMPK